MQMFVSKREGGTANSNGSSNSSSNNTDPASQVGMN